MIFNIGIEENRKKVKPFKINKEKGFLSANFKNLYYGIRESMLGIDFEMNDFGIFDKEENVTLSFGKKASLLKYDESNKVDNDIVFLNINTRYWKISTIYPSRGYICKPYSVENKTRFSAGICLSKKGRIVLEFSKDRRSKTITLSRENMMKKQVINIDNLEDKNIYCFNRKIIRPTTVQEPNETCYSLVTNLCNSDLISQIYSIGHRIDRIFNLKYINEIEKNRSIENVISTIDKNNSNPLCVGLDYFEISKLKKQFDNVYVYKQGIIKEAKNG